MVAGLQTMWAQEPFTAVNQLIIGTWYKSETEHATFYEDGTTDYIEGATYRFLPYQGNVIISNADGAIVNILRIYDMVDEHVVMGNSATVANTPSIPACNPCRASTATSIWRLAA